MEEGKEGEKVGEEEGGRLREETGGGRRGGAEIAGKKTKISEKKARKIVREIAHAAHADLEQKSMELAYEIILQN